MSQVNVTVIARTCHEVNRAICETFGDTSQKPWPQAEDWQRDSAIAGVRFALEHPDATPEDQHVAWCEAKVADGWTYGETKDADAKTHPCLVAYAQLPPEQRVKDATFRAVVAEIAPRLAQPGTTDDKLRPGQTVKEALDRCIEVADERRKACKPADTAGREFSLAITLLEDAQMRYARGRHMQEGSFSPSDVDRWLADGDSPVDVRDARDKTAGKKA